MVTRAEMNVRLAAVAGLFYPADPGELAAVVDRCLEDAVAPTEWGEVGGIVAPHAGYTYSGTVAGSAFRALCRASGRPRRVVIIGPSHRVAFDGVATSPADRFRTPLGEIEVDRETTEALERLPGVLASEEAHAREHSIEVELPFLQRALGSLEVGGALDSPFQMVPLVVGRAAPETVARVLAEALTGPADTLVVSSDLSHFLSSSEARQVDGNTARRVEARVSDIEPAAACGAAAINGLSLLARERGWCVECLDLRNSGDVTGERDRVVGYGAFVFGSRSGLAPTERAGGGLAE